MTGFFVFLGDPQGTVDLFLTVLGIVLKGMSGCINEVDYERL